MHFFLVLQYDSEIAKLLFTLIIQSLIEKTEDSNVFVKNMIDATDKVFKTTVQYNPSVMGALLELAVEYKDSIKYQPELIATVCQSSGLLSTGITIFEEYLLAKTDISEPDTKRIRTSENLGNDCWIYLSEYVFNFFINLSNSTFLKTL